MTNKELIELLDYFQASNINELKYKNDNVSIKVSKAAIVAPVAVQSNATVQTAAIPVEKTTQTAPKKEGNEVCAPLVGTFYASSAPDAPAFIKKGQAVKKGDVMCIIEAMKMLNEVKAPYDCEVIDILVENEVAVGFEQPLFLVLEK